MADSVSRYQPQGATRLPDLMDRLFRESFVTPGLIERNGVSVPRLPVNLFETPDSYVMHAALPGLNLDNLEIQVVGREVTVKGKVRDQHAGERQLDLAGPPHR